MQQNNQLKMTTYQLLYSSILASSPKDIASTTIEAFEELHMGWLHEKQEKDIRQIASILLSYLDDPIKHHLRQIHDKYLEGDHTKIKRLIAAIEQAFDHLDGEEDWLDVFTFENLTREQVEERGLAKNEKFQICCIKENKKVLKRITKLLTKNNKTYT